MPKSVGSVDSKTVRRPPQGEAQSMFALCSKDGGQSASGLGPGPADDCQGPSENFLELELTGDETWIHKSLQRRNKIPWC